MRKIQVKQIFPNPDERALILGMTGSGKTQLAIYFMRMLNGLCQIDILDTKGEPAFEKAFPDAVIIEKFDDLFKKQGLVRIYRPPGEELAVPDILDEYLQLRYESAPGLTYIDELLSLGAQTKPKPGFLNLLTRGRSRRAAVWMSSQRPAWVSMFPFSESNRFYVFWLNNEEDRKKVVKFTSPALIVPPRYQYGFWYYRTGYPKAVQFKPISL